MILDNKYYDVLKWVTMVLLPASGGLYFGIAQIWGLPLAEEVVGTIAVINAFLGTLLGISNHNYNKEQ